MEESAVALATQPSSAVHQVSTQGRKPYVVSLDIETLFERWATAQGFQTPARAFFTELRHSFAQALGEIFDDVELLDEAELGQSMSQAIARTNLPIISLDQVYSAHGFPLHVTRAVRTDMADAGVTHRGGTHSLKEQVQGIAQHIQGDVVLVDDVIFSGDLLARDIIPLLSAHGITAHKVITAVGIGDGVKRITDICEVECVRTFPQVEDEVCERDFYPGVLMSGRTVLGAENTGMPYVYPFGNPHSWASIPQEHVQSFSRFCIEASERLFAECERVSKRVVLCSDLQRFVFSLPTGDERFVDVLKQSRMSF